MTYQLEPPILSNYPFLVTLNGKSASEIQQVAQQHGVTYFELRTAIRVAVNGQAIASKKKLRDQVLKPKTLSDYIAEPPSFMTLERAVIMLEWGGLLTEQQAYRMLKMSPDEYVAARQRLIRIALDKVKWDREHK